MEIIIGRDSQNERLTLAIDGKGRQIVTTGALPSSIATQHCKLIIDNGQMKLENLDINYDTYVNGQSIQSKMVSQNDRVELGSGHFLFDWKLLSAYLPTDIRHLKDIWDEYENENVALQIKERKFNTLRSATGLITMFAIVMSVATGGRSKWYVVLYGIAILISLVFFVKAYLDSSKMPQKRLELNRKFQRDYVCPHCKHSLGNLPYETVAQNGSCPYCRTQFIH